MTRRLSKQFRPAVSITLALTALTLLSGIVLSSSTSSADDEVVTNVAVTVPVSCMMTGTEDTAHNANVTSSTYQDNIGLTTLKVICNENSGFSIYAIGYSNNEFGNNKLLATVSGELMPTYDIVTGTNKSGNTSNWAMKLNPVTGGSYTPTIENDYNDYNNVPSVYTKVATFASSTDTTIGASVQATYAAYINPEQPAGTYNGKVKFTMVHPASEVPAQPQTTQSGQICYYANATDAVGTMGCQTIPTSGTKAGVSPTSATLLASNFSRTGYGFAGWSDAFDYETNENAKFYGPQETITYKNGQYVGEGKGLSLYAVWVKSAGNLQDATKVAELCGTGANALTVAPATGANLSSVSALTDQRDNQTYAIAKLADGNCWMIENLRLESRDTVGQNRFNSSITNESLAQGYSGQFAGLADAEPAWANNNITTANSLYSTDGANDTINIGTSDASYRFPRYNNVNTPTNAADRPQNPTTNGATNSTSNASMYSYGNYYTWAAAIADTTAYSSGDHNTTSICPTGWQLPLGKTSTGDIEQGASDAANKVTGFSYLDRKMGGTGGQNQSTATDSLRWRKFPVNIVYSGYVYDGSMNHRGGYGYFWSSTVFSSNNAYNLYLYSTGVYPGTNSNFKYNGWTVRCVTSGV